MGAENAHKEVRLYTEDGGTVYTVKWVCTIGERELCTRGGGMGHTVLVYTVYMERWGAWTVHSESWTVHTRWRDCAHGKVGLHKMQMDCALWKMELCTWGSMSAHVGDRTVHMGW